MILLSGEQSIAKAVAREFGKVLHEWLTLDQLAYCVAHNNTYGDTTAACPTHDVCDANMAMDEAFDRVGADVSIDVWNEAWDIARQHIYFWGEFSTE